MGTHQSLFKATLLILSVITPVSGCKLSDIDGSSEGLVWDLLDGKEDRSGPTRGYKPVGDNGDYSYEQANAICKPQAELAGDQATNGYSRAVNQSGGKWAAANDALTRSQNRRKTTRNVMASCMAQYGWVK